MQSSPTCDQAEEDLIPAICMHQKLDAKYEKVDVKDVAQKQIHLIQKAKCSTYQHTHNINSDQVFTPW